MSCPVCGVHPATKICSNCKARKFCSIECQRKDWKTHKNNCTPGREASAAASLHVDPVWEEHPIDPDDRGEGGESRTVVH